MLLSGRLGDLFGNKRVFLGGVVSFAAASIACGIAPALSFLSSDAPCRGWAAPPCPPVALALIMGLFTDPAERAKAMAYLPAW